MNQPVFSVYAHANMTGKWTRKCVENTNVFPRISSAHFPHEHAHILKYRLGHKTHVVDLRALSQLHTPPSLQPVLTRYMDNLSWNPLNQVHCNRLTS